MHLKEALDAIVDDVIHETYDSVPDRIRARLLQKHAALPGWATAKKWGRAGRNFFAPVADPDVLKRIDDDLLAATSGIDTGVATTARRMSTVAQSQIDRIDDELRDVARQIMSGAALTDAERSNLFAELQGLLASASKTKATRAQRDAIAAKIQDVADRLTRSGLDRNRAKELTTRAQELTQARSKLLSDVEVGTARSEATAAKRKAGLETSAAAERSGLESDAATKGARRRGVAYGAGATAGGVGGLTGIGAMMGEDDAEPKEVVVEKEVPAKLPDKAPPVPGADVTPYLYGIGGGFAGGAGLRALYNKLTGERAGKGVIGAGMAGAFLTPAAIAVFNALKKGNDTQATA